ERGQEQQQNLQADTHARTLLSSDRAPRRDVTRLTARRQAPARGSFRPRWSPGEFTAESAETAEKEKIRSLLPLFSAVSALSAVNSPGDQCPDPPPTFTATPSAPASTPAPPPG